MNGKSKRRVILSSDPKLAHWNLETYERAVRRDRLRTSVMIYVLGGMLGFAFWWVLTQC
jgi:hypothetical protein